MIKKLKSLFNSKDNVDTTVEEVFPRMTMDEAVLRILKTQWQARADVANAHESDVVSFTWTLKITADKAYAMRMLNRVLDEEAAERAKVTE